MKERKATTLLNAYFFNLISKAADIVYFLLLVSLLEKSAFGQFNTLMAMTMFFLVAIDFGLADAGLREFAQKNVDALTVLKRAAPSRLLMLLLALVVLPCVVAFNLLAADNAKVLMLLCLYQFSTGVQSLLLNALRGYERQTQANQIASAEAFAKLLALIFVSHVLAQVDIVAVTISLLLVKCIFTAIAWWLVARQPRVCKVLQLPRRHVANPLVLDSQVGFLFIALLTIFQNRLDWLMVSALMDATAVATYSVINRYYEILLFALGIGFTTLYPWLCRLGNDARDAQVLRLLRQLQFLPVPLLVTSALVAFPLINLWVWQGRYDDATNAIAWLLPCTGLAVGNMMLYYALMARRRENILLYLCALSTAMQAMWNLWAIPHMGLHGAIAGMWLMNAANLLLFSVFDVRDSGASREVLLTVGCAVAISGALLFAAQNIEHWALLFIVLAFSAVVALALWLVRARMVGAAVGSAS